MKERINTRNTPRVFPLLFEYRVYTTRLLGPCPLTEQKKKGKNPLTVAIKRHTTAFYCRSTHGQVSVGRRLDVGPDGLGVRRQLSAAGRGAGRAAAVVAAAAAAQTVQQLRHRGQAQQQQHQEVQYRNGRLTSRYTLVVTFLVGEFTGRGVGGCDPAGQNLRKFEFFLKIRRTITRR